MKWKKLLKAKIDLNSNELAQLDVAKLINRRKIENQIKKKKRKKKKEKELLLFSKWKFGLAKWNETDSIWSQQNEVFPKLVFSLLLYRSQR